MNIISLYDIYYSLFFYLIQLKTLQHYYYRMLTIDSCETKQDLISFHLSRMPTPELSNNPKEWCALFIRYPSDELSTTYKVIMTAILKHQGIKNFLIAKEDPDHFHLLLQCPDYDYQNWIAAIKKKLPFTLAGKNSGTIANFGKVKLIKNLDKMLSYTVKENNYLCSFDSTEWMKRQKELSFKKAKLTRYTFREKLFKFLSDRHYHDLRSCMIRIIDFYRCQDPPPGLSRQAIKNHALNYFMTLRVPGTEECLYTYSSESLYDILTEY